MSLFSYPTTISTTVEIEEITSLSKGTLIVGDGTGAPTTLAVGTNGQILIADSTTASGLAWGGTAITGPGSSTDNAIVRWDGTAGTSIQNSVVTIGDTGAVDGVTTLDLSSALTWDTGVAAAGFNASYAMFRDNSTTNLQRYNVPTNSAHRWSVNGVDVMDLNVTRLNINDVANLAAATNSRIEFLTTGLLLSRNVADANVAVIIQNKHASSTGNILEVKNDVSTPFLISQAGAVTATGGGSLTGTWSNLGSVTTIDINGGTIDGVTIGGAVAGAITGTTITATSIVIGANTITTAEWANLDGLNQTVATTSSPTFVNLTITSFAANWTNAGRTVADLGIVTTVDINGGTVDSVTIGGASAAAGTFTALVATSLDLNGALDLDVAALGATITNTADAASSQVMILEGDRATMVDNDEAYLTLRLSNDGGVQTEFARITWVATDVNAATSVDGRLDFAVVTAGVLADELQLDGAALSPSADGGLALGTVALGYNGLFLNTGTAINWENSDVAITHSAGTLTFTGNFVGSNAASGAFAGDAAGSGTVPTFSPIKTDTDTGIGSAGADILSLIAGAAEVVRLTEAGVSGNTLTLAGGTLTSGGTSDETLDMTATLNDAGAAGGSDVFTMLRANLTVTNATGWNQVYLFDFQVDGSSRILYDRTNTQLTLGSSAATQINIQAEDQGSGNNTAGRPLLISAGKAGTSTTGAGGGNLFLAAGNAGGTGGNNGGNINLTPGDNTGAGQDGAVNINQPGGVVGTDSIGIAHNGTDGIFINLDTGGDLTFGIGAGNTSFSVSSESVITAANIDVNMSAGGRLYGGGIQANKQDLAANTNLTLDENDGVVNVTTGAVSNNTITLPAASGNEGMIISVYLVTDGGLNANVVRAGADVIQNGSADLANTQIALDDAGDFVMLQCVNSTMWQILVNSGGTVT